MWRHDGAGRNRDGKSISEGAMKFKSRLNRLEAMHPTSPWVPPIFFHPVVEPSENGPREVGAFAKFFLDGKNIMIWRSEDETHDDFKTRVMVMKASGILPSASKCSHE
jgi:hypothetical protein